jgi:DNA-binding transcriptional MerR regulator
MYFTAEHLISKLQISEEQLQDFEARGIVLGITKAGRTFYSSRDLYRLKGILFFMRTRGFSVERAREYVDKPGVLASAAQD